MMHSPTITDVAERAGCSIATVSAVLNDKATVSDVTRTRILQIIEELNYRPRQTARHRLRPNTGSSIGLIIKEEDNPYYGEVVLGVRRVAEEKGYVLMVSSSEGSFEAERRTADLMMSKDLTGLLITPVLDGDADLSHIFELKRRNIPFVLLEQVRGVQANLVDVDNVGASQAATAYLIDLGHSHIAHFAGPRYSFHSDERIEGVRRAFSGCQLAFREKNIIYAGAHPEDGYRAGLEYFTNTPPEERATAITCYNDLVAMGLLAALNELSIRVPEEVSVFGFDDLQILNYSPFALSTVHIPKVEMGAKAAEMLIQQIESDRHQAVQKVFLEHRLVIRRTTAPPPSR